MKSVKITFPEALSFLAGPSGCGKNNVLDAF